MASDGGAALEVEASDVVRVVLQFLKENGLSGSMAALQEESGVSLNATDNVDALVGDVLAGHWDLVLGAVGSMRLPQPLLSDLYEQVGYRTRPTAPPLHRRALASFCRSRP
jgi:WD40 repeat-containing protein SMU1